MMGNHQFSVVRTTLLGVWLPFFSHQNEIHQKSNNLQQQKNEYLEECFLQF